MSANDNILAGIAGVAEGVAGVYVPWMQAEHKARLEDQLMKSKSAQDLESKKLWLPYDEQSDMRKKTAAYADEYAQKRMLMPYQTDEDIRKKQAEQNNIVPLIDEPTGKQVGTTKAGAIKVGAQTGKGMDRRSDSIIRYSEAMERNPFIKELKKQDLGLAQVNELGGLIKGGNTVASKALGMKMARGMGEVGVMTDSDVTRYVQSGRLDRRSADTLSSWMQGKPTDATLQEIGQISDVLRDSYSTKVQSVHDTYVERLSRNYKIPPEEAAYLLAVDYSKAKGSKTENAGAGSGVGSSTGAADLGAKASAFLTSHGQADTAANRDHAISKGWVK